MTSWQYDPFARKSKEIRPDGTSTTWAYNICATAGCVNSNNQMTVVQTRLNTDSSTLRTDNTYLDTLDRTLVTSGQMLNGAYDRDEIRYDNLGNVHLQGLPCTFAGCTQYWITNTYDVLNRLTETQRPISATNSTLQSTTYGYQGRTTTVTDPQSKVTTLIALVTGKLARTTDHNGYYVNLNRDAFGSLVSTTDKLSNTLKTVTYQYGLKPWPVSSTDMDLGNRSYTIDALGEVTAYSDAKGQTFSTTYDALSRPLIRTESDLTTTWTWGTSAVNHNVGKLQSVSEPGYAETYLFDSAGRPIDRSISSDAGYSYDTTYSATTGLLDTLSYPTSTAGYRLKLQYGYQNGLPQQVKDANASTIFWQATTANPRGQVTQETLGNGIVTNRAFDAVTGWLGSNQSGVGGGAAVQNESYLFDLVGNVTQRQNGNAGLTENFYYDNLYRLDHSVLGSVTTLQFTYDAMGDITSRNDIAGGATWTYDATRKHALTQAGNSSLTYTYDQNGNAITRNGYQLVWSSYNYPTSINSNGKNVAFSYDPNRLRYEQIYTSGAGTETTLYVGGLMEKVTTGSTVDWRHYIREGNQLIAIMSRQNSGTNTTHYVLEDHEGSLAKITDGTGATTVSESFSAFGTRRDPTTWSSACDCADLSASPSAGKALRDRTPSAVRAWD